MAYCIYLRKSRADMEAEARGEGETLAKHEKALLEIAKKYNYPIVKQYREIVSGENIAARPQMQQLLADVNDNKYDGVLVMEVERLARGDTIDQGVVAQAFKSSSTKIITPIKVYDPENEFDEEYFEFSLFMSRREYKTIKRRMNAGRIAVIKDGNYITPTPPYGYKKISPEPKVYTLEIVPEEAEIIKHIFNLRLSGKGNRAIAEELNRMGVAPKKSPLWEKVSIRKILTNPVYAGKIHWYSKTLGTQLFEGRHEAIIPEETFNAVQDLIQKNPAAQTKANDTLLNYYHDILYCSNCGHQLTRRFIQNSGKEHLLCRYNTCKGKVVSSTLESVDELIFLSLREKYNELKSSTDNVKKLSIVTTDKAAIIEAELTRLKQQQSKAYDFLEQGIYSTETFLERSVELSSRIKNCEIELAECHKDDVPEKLSTEELASRIELLLKEFDTSGPEKKNELLRNVIKKASYSKTMRVCYRNKISDLDLQIEFL